MAVKVKGLSTIDGRDQEVILDSSGSESEGGGEPLPPPVLKYAIYSGGNVNIPTPVGIGILTVTTLEEGDDLLDLTTSTRPRFKEAGVYGIQVVVKPTSTFSVGKCYSMTLRLNGDGVSKPKIDTQSPTETGTGSELFTTLSAVWKVSVNTPLDVVITNYNDAAKNFNIQSLQLQQIALG